jgi:DNA-binding CsgD family transcriptional regulator
MFGCVHPSSDASLAGARGLRVGVLAPTVAMESQVAGRLLETGGAEVCAPDAVSVQVFLYAAQTPQEQVRLLEPTLLPPPKALLFDLSGGIGPETAALLGFLGYLPAAVPEPQLVNGLQEVAGGFPYAPEPRAGRFHQAREAGPLTAEARQLLRLAGQGYTQEQMAEALHLTRATLQRRVRAVKLRVGLDPRLPLIAAAERLGFGAVLPVRPAV